MSIYTGAILLMELLMLAMGYHVLYYPGFTKVEKTVVSVYVHCNLFLRRGGILFHSF